MKRKYTKQELKVIKDFLDNYDLGLYYKGEIYTIAKKTLGDLENDKNKTA